MSKIYDNGGLIGINANTSSTAAVGVWNLNTASDAELDNKWPITALDLVYDSKVDYVNTSTTVFGPTIPNNVDDTCIGVLLEYTSVYDTASNVPADWTVAGNSALTSGAAASRICYRILNTSLRGTSPSSLYGGNQRDQLYIFKINSGTITSLSHQNFQNSSNTSNLTANAPTGSYKAAIAIHYFYNSQTDTPAVSSSPSMTLLRSGVNNFHGGQYIIYNNLTSPVTQVAGGTFAGTIQQSLFWLLVN